MDHSPNRRNWSPATGLSRRSRSKRRSSGRSALRWRRTRKPKSRYESLLSSNDFPLSYLAQPRGHGLAQWVLGNKQRDAWPKVDVFDASALIREVGGKIKAGPAVAFTFGDRTRWSASALIVGNRHRYRSAWRT